MSNDLEKINTVNTQAGDLEVGATDAIQRHYTRQVVSRQAVSQKKLNFERRRPRWLRECIAEAAGVFFYGTNIPQAITSKTSEDAPRRIDSLLTCDSNIIVYPGIATTANYLLAASDPTKAPDASGFSSFLQIGLSYGIGIAFAIIVFGSTSGGHFNPAVTLNLAYWQAFPWRKVPYFIFSQIFGAFMAGLIMMGQYNVQINEFERKTLEAGKGYVSNTGPAALLVTIPGEDQTNLGYLFLIEFFVDSFIVSHVLPSNTLTKSI